MSSRKIIVAKKAILAAKLTEIRKQSASIHEHIEFIRENAGLPPFASSVAAPAELLTMVKAAENEFVDFAKNYVPVYLGCCLIDQFKAHWSVEEKPCMAMFGQPFVDGFGNIEYENIYLPMLRLENNHDVKRFERFRASCQRASDLFAKFTETFSNLSGSIILRSELEEQCFRVIPKGCEAKHVWRTRITKYAKLLKIKIKHG